MYAGVLVVELCRPTQMKISSAIHAMLSTSMQFHTDEKWSRTPSFLSARSSVARNTRYLSGGEAGGRRGTVVVGE